MQNKLKFSVAAVVGIAAVSGLTATASAQTQATSAAPAAVSHAAKPTVVLVSGSFEDSSGWTDVTARLQRAGYPVIVPAVPLRGVPSDVAYVSSVLKNVKGPLVLAGHSYGGMLISQLAAENANVKALVYAAAFIPQAGESAGQLVSQFPGSQVGPDTTYTIDYPGGTDVYVKPESFQKVFAGDRTAAQAAVAAAGQRPSDMATFTTTVIAGAPTDIPKYAIVASQDHAIPPAAELFQAQRAGAKILTVRSSHDVTTSHPDTVADVITRAASGR